MNIFYVFLWICILTLGSEFQGQIILLLFNVWKIVKLFSKETVQFYSPVSNVLGFQFLHFLFNTCYCLIFVSAIMVGMKLYLTMILIYVSPMNSNVVHLFICLFLILNWIISSLLKYPLYILNDVSYQKCSLDIFSFIPSVIFFTFCKMSFEA